MIDLYIKDKYTGKIHKVGDDTHDCITVDEEGTIHYYNLQKRNRRYWDFIRKLLKMLAFWHIIWYYISVTI